jgi:hypothetical protein
MMYDKISYCKKNADLLGLHPMKCESRRILALLLLFVTITGLVMSFGENVLCAGEPPWAHENANASSVHDLGQIHDSSCPCTPSPSHSPKDHSCVGDCGSPCHAPLPSSTITLTHSRTFTYLFHAERTRYIPKVYLSLFVPPDSATI